MAQLTEQELKEVRETNALVQNFKLKLGELEMHRIAIADQVRAAQSRFDAVEAASVQKYGADAIIDIKTGEVRNGKD